ncbi:MAG TPA: DUF3054 domain-containing protein [Acidimicrobiales bacterium]|nr:DUF3054 domain-containing protein [Acidimicrobiales bacterium]
MNRVWIVVDVLIVLLFVGIGRSSHHHAFSVSGFLSTTWPFAVGLGLGWSYLMFRRRDGASTRGGVVVWLCTVVVGMVLRVLFGQGTAFAFILVALGFLGALMLGLRMVATRYLRRRRGGVSV